eukprot:gene4579-5610_t
MTDVLHEYALDTPQKLYEYCPNAWAMNLKDAVTWYPRAYMRANTSSNSAISTTEFYTENGNVRLCNSSEELYDYYYNQDNYQSYYPNYCDATLCMYPDYDNQDCNCDEVTKPAESCPQDTSYVCCTLKEQNTKTCYCLGYTDYTTDNTAAIRDAGVEVYTVDTYYSVEDHIHTSHLHSEYLDEFFTLDSMAWSDGSPSYGIGLDGDFVDNDQTVLRRSGLKTKEDLLRYPLTYAAGHPYYTTTGYNMRGLACGIVASDSSWSDHVRTCGAQKISLNTDAGRALNEVQVIEDAYDIGGAVYYISQHHVRLFGLVVRKNAVLFIDDIDTSIELTFLIVESGGLLQAGSRHNDKWRFRHNLTFTYTHDHFGDAGNGQVTAGLYSAEVHHPGVRIKPSTPQVRDYMGHNLNNNGVMKGAAVFFNGNLQLNGLLPGMATYDGTWRSNASASQTRATDGGTLPSQYPMT